MELAVLGGILVGGALGFLGSGGSIVLLPILIFVVGVPEKIAVAETLPLIAIIAALGALPHVWRSRVEWQAVAHFAPFGVLGTLCGSQLAMTATPELQMLIFGVVVSLAAWRMFRGKAPVDSCEPGAYSTLFIPLAGLGVGMVTGFVGVGGGFLIVPALTLLLGLPVKRAIATSMVLIAINAGVGYLKHRPALVDADVAFSPTMLAAFLVLGVLGVVAGERLEARVNPLAIRRVFALFLATVGLSLAAGQFLS